MCIFVFMCRAPLKISFTEWTSCKNITITITITIIIIIINNNIIDRPQMKDLYEHITPRYATKWRKTGTLLGLPTGALDIIENDNRGKAESCCNGMFEKWLDINQTASWGKLFDAGIELPTVMACNGKILNS